MNHKPVLLHETLENLALREGAHIADGTLGLGGHGKAILNMIGKTGKYYGFDLDTENLEEAKKRLKDYEKQTTFFHSNFVHCHDRLTEIGVSQIDGILLDLGLSSPHIDEPERGFSVGEEGPLDMRFDRNSDHPKAAELVNTWPEEELKRIIYVYGEERYAPKIARLIIERRQVAPFTTTTDLLDLIDDFMKSPGDKRRVATRLFQALRIAVNSELEVLEKALPSLLSLLTPQGRMVVISYHSLEDRLTKRAFKKAARTCVCPPEIMRCECSAEPKFKIITKKPIQPSEEEIAENPRSRSAKLRTIEKL